MSGSTFLALQMELVRQQKRLMKEYIEQTPELERFYEEYRQELQRFSVLSYPRELLERVAASQIVYVGDFHTLVQSQKFLVRLIEQLHKAPEVAQRKLVVAMEAFPASRQQEVDQYLRGDLLFDEFLSAVDYRRTWSFAPDGYKAILDTCHDLGVRVLAVNTFPRRKEDDLERRDAAAARLICRAHVADPEALIVVFFGDLHIATSHLPGRVVDLLGKQHITIRDLIVYLNSETIYWQLAKGGLEYLVNVVKVDSRRFCAINATPLAKYDSYLRFVEGLVDDDDEDDGEEGFLAGSVVVEDQVRDLAIRIGEYLGLADIKLCEVELVPAALGELADGELARSLKPAPEEAPIVAASIRSRHPIFVGNDRLLLHRFSLNGAADAAARVLLRSLGWKPYFERTEESFYYNVMFEALAFFGSKVINPKRTIRREADLEQLVLRTMRPRSRVRAKSGPDVRFVARYVLPHLRKVRLMLEKRARFRESPEMYGHVLRKRMEAMGLIGRRLGERLFFSAQVGMSERRMQAGKIRFLGRREVAELFTTPPGPGTDCLRLYLGTWRGVADVEEHHVRREDWF